MLVIYEAAGFSEFAEYLIRTLLSEGHLRYETVEKTAGGSLEARTIERDGPTGLIVTTTMPFMHQENETRYLSVTVADTPEQTKHILRSLAAGTTSGDVDFEPWQCFQQWLEDGSREVVVPYAEVLGEQIPPVAVRLRRDFGKLLTLIHAHALIHQMNRQKDEQDRVVAELEDYRAVHGLISDLIASGVDATVSPTTRETVDAVARVAAEAGEFAVGVTNAQVATALGLDKSATSRRIHEAIRRRYLVNLETRGGRPSQLVLGDPLPDDRTILPPPADVEAAWQRCTVAGVDAVPLSTDGS